MISISRWALWAVCGAILLGCGGKSKPAPEHDSGVVLSFTGFNSSGLLVTALEAGLFVNGDTAEIEGDSSVTVYRDTEVLLKDADADPDDDITEDVNVHVMEFTTSIEYINQLFESIGFSFNGSTYGYDITVYANDVDRTQVWNFQDILDWCVGIEEYILNEVPALEPTEEDTFDFGFNITDYSVPTSLDARESWSNSLDLRLASCPLSGGVADRWIGRKVDSIQQIVVSEYEQYVDDLDAYNDYLDDAQAAEDAGCVEDDVREVCDVSVVDEPSKPTGTSLREAVLINADLVDSLDNEDDSVEFEVELDISINEFNSLPSTFVFSLTVGTVDESEE